MITLYVEAQAPRKTLQGVSASRTNLFRAETIPLEQVLQFRGSATDGLWSTADAWDRAGYHIGFFLNNELQGVVRLNDVSNRKLPLNDAFPQFVPEDGDVQIGRLVIAKEARATRVVLFALKALKAVIDANPGRVIATPLAQDEGGLSERTFARRGFVRIYEPFISHEHRTLIPMIRNSTATRDLPSLESLNSTVAQRPGASITKSGTC